MSSCRCNTDILILAENPFPLFLHLLYRVIKVDTHVGLNRLHSGVADIQVGLNVIVCTRHGGMQQSKRATGGTGPAILFIAGKS